jgi:crossover junction endodeoxyribonuclease RuvC
MHEQGERRVLGVDPGLTRTGLGLVLVKGARISYLASQIIDPSPAQSLRDRLYQLYKCTRQRLQEWQPEVMVVENLIYARNAQVALKLGHARGVLLVAAAEHNLPIVEYSPREVKMAVTGYGAASKEQIQRMVKDVLNMTHPPETHDVADALALAICHAHRCGSASPSGLRP